MSPRNCRSNRRGELDACIPGLLGRCDGCSADVPSAMVVYRCGLVLSPADTVSDTEPALNTGLLGRCDALASQRPSVAPSACSLVGRLRGLRPRRGHAGGLPRSRESQDEARLPREPGMDLVRSGTRRRIVPPAQSHARHPEGTGFSARLGRYRVDSSWFRIEQPPGHGSDIVEELEGVVSVLTLKGMNSGKKAKMGVNLFR